jgi:glycosyltransferase involved in cell wall biosynthesis
MYNWPVIRPETTALVHDWLTVPGGAEEVLRETLHLFPGTVFTAQYNPARFPWLRDTKVRDTWLSRMPLSKSRHYLYAPILADIYSRMNLDGFELILTDSHTFAHHVRKPKGAIHICYYHTPARSLWVPEIDDRAGEGLVRTRIANRLRRLDLMASRNPDVVLANSNTTAERIRRVYKRDVEEVIYPPVDTGKWLDVAHESDDEGFLMWGRLIRYKKIDIAIEAVKKTGHRLNIVGSGPYEAFLRQAAGGAPNIRFHGRLPDDDLKKLMARSCGVLFPGYEDFGIVPVEAMAAGLPVIAFGQGGASETVGAGCGLLFQEQTSASLAEAIELLPSLEIDRNYLRARAKTYDTQVFRDKYSAAVRRHAG